MSRSRNKVSLTGRLGRDAETAATPSGTPVAKFSIATSDRFKNKSGEWQEETNWTNCVLWKNEGVFKFLTKGQEVTVDGRLKTHSYEDKSGKKVYVTEVICEELTLHGGDGRQESSPRASAPVNDDDIPF